MNMSNEGHECCFCKERISTQDEIHSHLEVCASKTDQCPQCHKFILRSIFAYHIDNNCTNPDLFNNPIEQSPKDTTETKFDSLFNRQEQIYRSLEEKCYQNEINHLEDKLQFNVVIMGSPRVGKSTLINALCDSNQAEVSSSLNSCTQKITCYTLKDNQQRMDNVKPFQINFYDTPGIESWEKKNGEMTMLDFIEKTNPLCVIYCASPGSFAKLDQLTSILQFCQMKQIFCALVCTNMWSSKKRDNVIEEFEKQLAFFGDRIEKYSNQNGYPRPHKITFFGDGALCTMVNSETYEDEDLLGDKTYPCQGIDELIHGIMESLDQDKLLGWCYEAIHKEQHPFRVKDGVEWKVVSLSGIVKFGTQ